MAGQGNASPSHQSGDTHGKSSTAPGQVKKTSSPAHRSHKQASRPQGEKPHGGNGAADRAGNNGTVKIDNAPFDSHPNNEPHVTCAFQVDFYNYGAGDYWANVHFALHPPTRSGRTMTTTTGDETPFIGEDPPGGGTDVDAQETYQLSFTGSPHPKQGYHVKLTINAPHSQGADTKHKVFWVKPCSSEEPPPGGGGGGDNPPGGSPPGGNPPGENPPGENPPGENPPGEHGQPSTPGVPDGGSTPIPPVPDDGSGSPVASSSGSATSARGSSSAGAAGASRESAAQVPTAVDAGLAGATHIDPSGSLLTWLLGVGGLLTAAGGVAAHRRRGSRQS